MAANATGADDFAEDLAILGARALRPHDPRTVGRYRIDALLGIGGMGRVYLGRPQSGEPAAGRDRAQVAVKVIQPDLADDRDFRRRFVRELEALRRVRSPYVAALIYGDAESPQPWIATEYVTGVSLSDAVPRGEPLPATSVWRLAHDLAGALTAVHVAGIVHRDIKPSNVILTGTGAKIIDFGVAYTSNLSQLTATGMNVGTPSFMSPEQARSGEISPASDVFSLGILLYFAASGRLPFGEGSTAEVLYRMVYEAPNLDALAVVEPALRDLILRCISKNPLERPNTGEVLAMTGAAAGREPWSADQAAPWPGPIAARISARILAAERALSGPLAEGPGASRYAVPSAPFEFAGPAPTQSAAETQQDPTGLRDGVAPRERSWRHAVLAVTVSAGVLGLGAAAFVVWSPGSGLGQVNAANAATAPRLETPAASLETSVAITHTPSPALTSVSATPVPSPESSSSANSATETTAGVITRHTNSSTLSVSPTTAETAESCGTLAPDTGLTAGQSLASCDGSYVLDMQGDGNLVLYESGSVVWASRTAGTEAVKAAMQTDGNFVLYTSGGSAVWFTSTTGNPGAHLSVQDTGDVVILSTSGSTLWSSRTSGQ